MLVGTAGIDLCRHHTLLHRIYQQMGPLGAAAKAARAGLPDVTALYVGRRQHPGRTANAPVSRPAEKAIFHKSLHYPVESVRCQSADQFHKRHFTHGVPAYIVAGLAYLTQQPDHHKLAYSTKLAAYGGHILSVEKFRVKFHNTTHCFSDKITTVHTAKTENLSQSHTKKMCGPP